MPVLKTYWELPGDQAQKEALRPLQSEKLLPSMYAIKKGFGATQKRPPCPTVGTLIKVV